MPSARPRTFTAALVVLALIAAFVATSQTARADESVSIPGMSFSPSSVTIEGGETVTWVHSDAEMPHTVTSTDGGPLDSGTLSDGEEYSFTFSEAGTFEYACAIHPAMTGSVTVQEAAANGDDSAANGDDAAANGDDGAANGDDAAANGDDANGEAAPPATGTGTADGASSVPWALIVVGILVIALAGGIFGIRALRN